MNDEIYRIIYLYENGELNEKDIIAWAIKQVESGNDSRSILLLASITKNEYSKVEDLFKQVMKEMNIEDLSSYSFRIKQAKTIAKDILEEKISPVKGCKLLGMICSELDYPNILSHFGLLSHELTGHEHLGITEDSLIPEIYIAAENLINNIIE